MAKCQCPYQLEKFYRKKLELKALYWHTDLLEYKTDRQIVCLSTQTCIPAVSTTGHTAQQPGWSTATG